MNDYIFIFDIGKVLLDFDFVPLQEKIAECAKAPLSQVRSEWSNEAYIEVETGKTDERVYFEQFCARIGLTWTFDQWVDHWADIFTPNPFMHGLYLDLDKSGCPVAMLSNIGPHHVTAIERGIPGFFDVASHHFFSFDLGLHKPDPAIYHAVSQRLEKQPQHCVFLDDVEANVQGAKSIGMHAMQVTPENHDAVERFVRSFTADDRHAPKG